VHRLKWILGLHLIAFWEVWRWYFTRAVYSWDQPWGLLAFIAALVFLFISKKPLPYGERSLFLPALLIVVYIATYFVLPPLGRAAIAFTALPLTLSSLRFGKSFHAGLFGLFYLSLPTIPTLQFFGGYPMRVVVAQLTAATKGNDRLRVYERIHSDSGKSWTDVSAWYWSALNEDRPWWAITVAEKER
jgi:hypothetical protein